MILFGFGIAVLALGGAALIPLKNSKTINRAGAILVALGSMLTLMAAIWTLAGSGSAGSAMGAAVGDTGGMASTSSYDTTLSAPSAGGFSAGAVYEFRLPLPFGAVTFALNPLSSFFLGLIALVCGLAAIYAPKYLEHYGEAAQRFKKHWVLFGILAASMMLVVTAQNAVLFMLAWEAMSLSSFFLVMFSREKAEVRRAGWIYLLFAHVGAACLIAMFSLMSSAAGSLEFEAMRSAAPRLAPALKGSIFILALLGFGMKAGFFPLYVWLPEAHPAAPSHVSAVMSGVMIKTAIYGIVLVESMLGTPALWMGITMLCVGLVSGLFGIAMAAVQRDAKRLLAYSSIENIGIIAIALGVWMLGAAIGNSSLAGLGLAAALLHTLNHALFKSLLFMGAGAMQFATHTLDLDSMGGLLKRMPRSGLAIIVGSVALSGLPPFNGFISEFLLYSSAFARDFASSLENSVFSISILGGLSLIGALAVFALTKFAGTGLLGAPRSEHAEHAREVSPWMWAPMLTLAALCTVIGLAPRAALALVDRALSDSSMFAGVMSAAGTAGTLGVPSTVAASTLGLPNSVVAFTIPAASLAALSAIQMGALILIALVAGLSALRNRRIAPRQEETWGCGYHAPSSRMQYTSSSFAQPLASFAKPFYAPQEKGQVGAELFPEKLECSIRFPDLILDRAIAPAYRWVTKFFQRFSVIQHGNTHLYVLYIVVALLVALFWSIAQ